jgi:isopentenyl diphosphate isomerase/L-lactate dehydrogenase-like FMN-dependent dehydrogenase
MCFGYLDSGSDDEVTLRRNHDAYTELEMHYNVLRGLKSPLDMSTTVFGKDVQIPFFACPTAGNRMFHHLGEKAVASAAKHHGSLYGLSTLCTTGIDEIGTILPKAHPKVFQLYVWKDRELVRDMLAQAREGGFEALALTVDFTWYGNRERDTRNEFTIPPSFSLAQVVGAVQAPAWTWDFITNDTYSYALLNKNVPAESLAKFVNEQISPEFTWKDAEWLCSEWQGTGPVAIKGIVRPDDAVRAIDHGFSTIWVSNHGGRQLNTSPAPIDVLPSIREAVGPDVEVILDGGVQRGTDICKALALGADSVGVGKPYLYGLGAGGTEGVIKALEILRVELERAMGLLGVATVAELQEKGPDLIRRRGASARDAMGARYSPTGII